MTSDKEKRTFDFHFEVRESDDSPPKIVGHAAVFNDDADIGGMFVERVKPGAFTDAINRDDVRALFNHDPNHVLGRNTAGTLSMKEDKQGLAVEIDPPDTQFANDLMTSMKRGDISQMSFGFRVQEERWIDGEEGKLDVREIEKVELFDVSPVTFPAYDNTDVAVRSLTQHKEDRKHNLTKHRVRALIAQIGGN